MRKRSIGAKRQGYIAYFQVNGCLAKHLTGDKQSGPGWSHFWILDDVTDNAVKPGDIEKIKY